MRRDDAVYLQHILDAIGKIEDYVAGMDRDAFQANTMAQDAVIRQLEIIGEATKRLSQGLRSGAAAVPGKTSPACETSSFTTPWGWMSKRSGSRSVRTCRSSRGRFGRS